MSLPASLVVLNGSARGGRAAELWMSVQPLVARHSRPEIVTTSPQQGLSEAVERAVAAGVRLFLAAGGDGTVNALVNALFQADPQFGGSEQPFTLGAVGLGSSNDFHKPVGQVHGTVPLSIDSANGSKRDVGVARYRDLNGVEHSRMFVVSASLGLTAEANATFNHPGPLLGWLQRHCTNAAIACAAIETLARYRSFPARLAVAGRDAPKARVELNSLSVMKTPYLSG